MKAFSLDSDFKVIDGKEFWQQNYTASTSFLSEGGQFDANLIKECIEGVLIFTDQKQLIYANEDACKILNQLRQEDESRNPIPEEIWHICQTLIQSRHLFPNQNWLIEFDIFTNAATTLHIRSRWLNIDVIEHPCLLLMIEDRQQAIANIFMEEAARYGLTPREKEVWLLQHNGYTYKQIAAELGITPNTVKKHMRSIHAKKKMLLGDDVEEC